ncbi:MAG: hypothetical protein PHX49_10030, partial [Bacteroidales bacterium]|nr:hypothetical protein [Bacteroidales bacterium]
LDKDVIINPNPRVYKALKNELQAVCEQLARLTEINEKHYELLELTKYIAVILAGVKGEINDLG